MNKIKGEKKIKMIKKTNMRSHIKKKKTLIT